jgi:hypothetical protein
VVDSSASDRRTTKAYSCTPKENKGRSRQRRRAIAQPRIETRRSRVWWIRRPRTGGRQRRTHVRRRRTKGEAGKDAALSSNPKKEPGLRECGGFVGLGPDGDEGVLKYAEEAGGRSRRRRRTIASLVASPTGLEPVCFNRNLQLNQGLAWSLRVENPSHARPTDPLAARYEDLFPGPAPLDRISCQLNRSTQHYHLELLPGNERPTSFAVSG